MRVQFNRVEIVWREDSSEAIFQMSKSQCRAGFVTVDHSIGLNTVLLWKQTR